MSSLESTMMQADLRSDTITKPDAAIVEAMAMAQVGDDCYGDDPSVYALESYCAELFGKEAALFTCSGTMSNQIALRAHTKPGDEIIVDHTYHINFFESAACSNLAHVVLNTIHSKDGVLDVADIQAAYDSKPRAPIYSQARLVCLENTIAYHGGKVFPVKNMERIGKFAREMGLKVHLDGARLMNACDAAGEPPTAWAKHADTVSLCFAKGLGAPFGSILAGDSESIARARAYRKWYGGALHQSGYMAAAALASLQRNVVRLADDHENARLLNTLLKNSQNTVPVYDEVDTNIVLFDVAPTGLCAKKFSTVMETFGVRLFPWLGTQVRAITHQNVSAEQVEWAAHKIMEVANNLAYEHAKSYNLKLAA